MDYLNLPLGLRVQTQIPLDVKEYALSEADLIDLGPSNNLAFTYIEGLIIYCVEEKTRWEWREVIGSEEGLRPSNFTYPSGITAFGINYSNRVFNFFKFELGDATSTEKGGIILTGDLGGTADNPTTPTAIHITGDEVKEGSLTVDSIIVAGGTSNQFLKADGSLDSNTYALDSGLIHTTGNEVKTGTLTVDSIIKAGGTSGQYLMADGSTSTIANSLFQFQVIELDVDNAYIAANFDGTGLGINLMAGLAMCNGNNGTKNRGGRVGVAYGGAPYNVMGNLNGSANAVLVAHEHHVLIEGETAVNMPVPFSTTQSLIRQSNNDGEFKYSLNPGIEGVIPDRGLTSTAGTNAAGANMQPYIISLFVQKL